MSLDNRPLRRPQFGAGDYEILALRSDCISVKSYLAFDGPISPLWGQGSRFLAKYCHHFSKTWLGIDKGRVEFFPRSVIVVNDVYLEKHRAINCRDKGGNAAHETSVSEVGLAA